MGPQVPDEARRPWRSRFGGMLLSMTSSVKYPVPEGFEQREIALLGETRTVFCGGDGPAIIVMHEAPGLHPGVAGFGRHVIDAGFTVYMPSLIGVPGKPVSVGYSLHTIARACVSREFTMWASNQNSPITVWLRALARLAQQECGGSVGAIGMCLTGGFALAMMVEDCVTAPVLSQPSLPVAITRGQKRDLGIDAATLQRVKQRSREDGVCVLGLRFTGDWMVPPQRFERLRRELGDNFLAVEIDSSWGNPHRIPRTAHSVLAYHFVDRPGHPTRDALDRVLDFFRERVTP